jgi:hypothetical protein
VAGLLERPPLEPLAVEPEEVEPGDVETTTARGRGATSRKPKTTDARATRRVKGRTIYLHDDLFERIIVQAHRRRRTISEYVSGILDRQVPDHRVIRSADPATDVA